MDESKIMRKSFTLVQQSITEFLRYFKQSIEIAILERRYKSASEMEQEMLRVHEAPSMYTLVTVESGSEQDFINILNEKGIESIYVNSDFLSDYNGSWIISIDDFEKLQKDAETLGILIEREKNEELEMEEDSYDERDISDEFSTEEDLEKEKEEEEKEIEESGYSNDSEIPVEDEIERKERKSQEKKEIKKGQIPVSVTSENFPYESDSYRTATEPVSEYDSSPRISEDIVIPVISEYNSEPVSESVTEPPVYETPSFQNPQMESVFSQETTAKPCDKYPETDSEQSVSGNSQDSYIGTHGQEIKNDATPCTRYNNPAREQPEQNQFSATTNIPESNEYEKRQESVTHTDYESGRSTESSYPESKPGIEYKQPEPVIPDVRTEIPVSRTSQTEQHPHESGDTYPSDFSNHDQYTSEFVSHHEEVKTPEPVFEKQSGMDTGAGSSTNGLERVPSSPITDHADFEYLHGEKKAPDPEKVDHFIQDPNKESGDQEYTQKEPVYEYQKQEELKKYPDSESDLRSRQYTDRILEVDDRQKEAGFHPTPEITKHSSEYEARSLEQKNQGVSFEQAPVSITHESENQEVPNKDKSLVTDFAQSNSSSFHSDQNPNYGFSRKQDSFSQSESYSKEDQKSETFTGPLKQAPTPKSVSPRTFDTEYKTDPKTDTTAPVSEKDPAFKIRDQFSSKKPEQKDSDVDRNLSFRPDHDQVSTESAKDSFLGNEGSAYIKGRDSGSKPAIDPIIKQKPEQDYKSQQGKEPFTDPLQSTEKHSGISSGIKNSDTQFAGSRDSAENKANLAPGAFKDSLRNVGSQDKISSSPSDNISKAGILNKATGTEKPDTKDLLSKDPLSLAKEKRDLDTKKSSDKDDDKLKLKATDITRVVYSGHHDSFNKAIFHAAFDSAAEETDFYKGTKALRSQGLVDVARATSIFAAKTSLVKDVELLTRDLSPDQIKLLSKMIESGNYGIFDLDDPLKYKESMVSLHKFMRDNNMLQKRSIRNAGAETYSLGADKTVYEGNFIDRKMKSYREEIVRNDKLNVGKGKTAGSSLSKNEKKTDIKGSKDIKKKITNREQATENLRKQAEKLGASTKDSDMIVSILFRHNKKIAETDRLLMASGKGLKNLTSLNPVNNTLVSGSLKEDQNFRYVYRTKSAVQGAKALYHAGSEIVNMVAVRRQAVLSRKINQMDEKLLQTSDPLTQDRLGKTKAQLEKKHTNAKRFNENQKIKAAEKIKKAEKNAKIKAERVDKLKTGIKKPMRKLKCTAEKVPGLKKVLNFKPKPPKLLVKMTSGVKTIFSVPGTLYTKIVEFLVTKLLIPILGFIGPVFLIICGTCLCLTLLMTLYLVITSFFSTEDGAVDDATATVSTMRIVYDELTRMETKWANNLITLTEDLDVGVDELTYSEINESTGQIIPGRESLDAATYIREVLNLVYDEDAGVIYTPSPWPGAPDEASTTTDDLITGGTELRYIGTGGYPGYTSNVMEIISMASIAQYNSTLHEFEDTDLSDANDEGLFNTISNFFGSVWTAIRTVASKAGQITTRIASVIPGFSDFIQNQRDKARMRTMLSYSKPLFDISHQIAFGLQFSFLPTDRSLTIAGAESINQFVQNSWYSFNEGGGNSAALSEISDSEVARQVWTYLLEHGFDEIHAAGVLGNFYQESRMNPNAEQYPGMRRGGIGLGQWTGLTSTNNRRLKLEQYAASHTGSSDGWRNNVKLQLDYMLAADEPATVRRYLSMSFADPAAAAYWWGMNWERFDVTDGTMNSTRIPAANAYYKIYADEQMFEFTETDDIESGAAGVTSSSVTGTNYNEEVKYAYTGNIDENGEPLRTYRNNMQQTKTVTINGATSLNVELWYSTEDENDWLIVTNKDQGALTSWNSPSVGMKFTGGDSTEKPSDNSSNHTIFEIDGDTVHFNFYSDYSVTKYGYYAKITGKVIDNSWLDEQIAQADGYTTVMNNVHTCEGHNGHGCREYAGFTYDDTTRQYVYYDGEKIESIYPAGLDPDESGEYPCNAPAGSLAQFDEAFTHNAGCWTVEESAEYTGYSCRSGGSGSGSSVFDSYSSGHGYDIVTKSPQVFSIKVITDIDHDYDSYTDEFGTHDEHDTSDCEYTYKYYTFTHNCQGNHTGYYCGGHMKLIVYGIVYHMTTEQRANNHDAYTEKTATMTYKKGYSADYYDSADKLYYTSEMEAAQDLFDLDHSIVHVKNSVNEEFEGWTYDNIDSATIPLLSDWNELYGITTSWTVNGINGAASGGADATTVSNTQRREILEAILDQLPHDTTDQMRVDAINLALNYVGKISYSQLYHGSVLREGGKNDCSGFVSRVYYNVIQKILNTDSFVSWARQYGAYRNFSDGNCKPGDILLSGMGNATRKDNHALLYVGEIDGTHKSIDCSNRGGNGSVYYSDRGNSYYANCTYIDMSIAIRGYLTLHPENAGDLYPENIAEE